RPAASPRSPNAMTTRFRLPAAALLLSLAAAAAPALASDAPYAPDTPEPGSVEKIKEFTTDAKYLPESVSYVPDSATVPSPEKVIGHLAGAPGELSDCATVYKYFRALDAASDRVTVTTIGKTEEGRDIVLAAIADADTLKQIDRYKGYTEALADPRKTDRAAMETSCARATPTYD